MSLRKPNTAYYAEFCTNNPFTAAAADADTLPVATVNKNGVDDGASPTGWNNTLTVTKIATGRYNVTGTIPADYVAGDSVQVSVSATVAGSAGTRVIDGFMVDTQFASDLKTEIDANETQIDTLAELVATIIDTLDDLTEADGDGHKFTAAALAETPSEAINVTLGAVQVSSRGGNRLASPISLEMFQGEEKQFALTVNDADGDPVELSGLTLEFRVQDSSEPPNEAFIVSAENIVVSGDDNEIATVTVAATDSATASTELHWRLWDTGTPEVLAYGYLKILPAIAAGE